MSDTRLLVRDTEAARMLDMGRSTFREAVRNGKLPNPIKIGGATRWLVSDLQQHLQAMRTTRPSTPGAAVDIQPGCTQP